MRKRERNRIYRRALKEMKVNLRVEVEVKFRTGLCSALRRASDYCKNWDVDAYVELRKDFSEQNQFPEIIKHKPEKFMMTNYWFLKDDEGIQKRISILKQAIEETK